MFVASRARKGVSLSGNFRCFSHFFSWWQILTQNLKILVNHFLACFWWFLEIEFGYISLCSFSWNLFLRKHYFLCEFRWVICLVPLLLLSSLVKKCQLWHKCTLFLMWVFSDLLSHLPDLASSSVCYLSHFVATNWENCSENLMTRKESIWREAYEEKH